MWSRHGEEHDDNDFSSSEIHWNSGCLIVLNSLTVSQVSHTQNLWEKQLSPDRDERASELKPLSWRMAKGYSSSCCCFCKWLEFLATMDTYIEAEYNTSKNHGESQCDTLNISECYLVILNLFLRGIHGDLLNLWTFGGEGIQQFTADHRWVTVSGLG